MAAVLRDGGYQNVTDLDGKLLQLRLRQAFERRRVVDAVKQCQWFPSHW